MISQLCSTKLLYVAPYSVMSAFQKTLDFINQKPAIIISTRLVQSDIALFVESTAKPFSPTSYLRVCRMYFRKNCLLPKDNFLNKNSPCKEEYNIYIEILSNQTNTNIYISNENRTNQA